MMFDYVTRKDYEAERDARVRAEAIADELRASLKEERQRVTDLLKILHPEAEKPPLITGVGSQGFLSSEQIRRQPAVGLRGLREKTRLMSEAKARETEEDLKTDAETRRATLDPAEAELIDSVVAGR